jgi:hypothetical protein
MAHTTSIYGDSEGWNIAYYIFTGCRGFLFFVVVILLATGGWVGGHVCPVCFGLHISLRHTVFALPQCLQQRLPVLCAPVHAALD